MSDNAMLADDIANVGSAAPAAPKRPVKAPLRKTTTTRAGQTAGTKGMKKIAKPKTIASKNATATTTIRTTTTDVETAIVEHSADALDPAVDNPVKRRSLTGRALVTRVARAVERELAEIEAIVGKTKNRTEAERRARTLASLARTLGDVTRLREQHQARRDDDDDTVPRDLDEFRETLARRLEKLLAVASAGAAGDPDTG